MSNHSGSSGSSNSNWWLVGNTMADEDVLADRYAQSQGADQSVCMSSSDSSRTLSLFASVFSRSGKVSTFGSLSLSSSWFFGRRCYPCWVAEGFTSPGYQPGFHNRNSSSLSALSSLSLSTSRLSLTDSQSHSQSPDYTPNHPLTATYVNSLSPQPASLRLSSSLPDLRLPRPESTPDPVMAATLCSICGTPWTDHPFQHMEWAYAWDSN